MLYYQLLNMHSLLRWVALLALASTFLFLLYKQITHGVLTKQNYRLLQILCVILNLQLLVGIFLFYESPIVSMFWNHFNEGVKIRQPRFFGLEHPSMMFLGILLFNYFTYQVKKKINTNQAISYLFKRLVFVLILILSSIPWSFSPLTSRPNFRFFN